MDKIKRSLSKKTARMRGWIQAAATLLTNIHISNLFKGKIYQGKAKTICVPGLNCYSCPAATGACPIGAFQAVVGSFKFKFSYYITGFFILLGVILGRFICGFLCPFGWFQDLLHKIPGKKFSTARLKPLRYLKYIILIVFVILLPMLVTNSIGMGDPFFCKYICPQGVLEGAIPLSLGNTAIRSALGKLFSFIKDRKQGDAESCTGKNDNNNDQHRIYTVLLRSCRRCFCRLCFFRGFRTFLQMDLSSWSNLFII